jgi:hypothetical protein
MVSTKEELIKNKEEYNCSITNHYVAISPSLILNVAARQLASGFS